MSAPPLQLDYFGDLACPWCYLGWRRVQRARALQGTVETTLRFRAHELQPGLPEAGMAAEAFFLEMFGGPLGRDQAFRSMSERGTAEGAVIDFARIRRVPNTFLAHRVVRLAARQGAEHAVVDALYAGHFAEGLDLGSPIEVLAHLRRERVVEPLAALERALALGEGADEVREDQRIGRELQITGAPCLVADRKHVLRGADSVGSILELIGRAAELAARGS